MFDIGFSEVIMFGAMALIVLAPEKLPVAARAAGKWYVKIRHTVSNIQNEIESEFNIAETRRQMQEELAKIREAEEKMQAELREMRSNMQKYEETQSNDLSNSTTTSTLSSAHIDTSSSTSSDTSPPNDANTGSPTNGDIDNSKPT